VDFYKEYFDLIGKSINSVDFSAHDAAVSLITTTGDRGGKIIIAGNGGSAAIASHVSVDFTKVAKIRAVNFNEADLITCLANDYGYERWVEKAIDLYADQQDTVILISSSGKSPNMVNAGMKAKEMKMPLITFTGFDHDNPLNKLGDIRFFVDSRAYNIVEMTHQV
jgi:D-sedoheptulose 7-phosphate isomerase